VIARLKKIPGVGDICAARFVAYVADPHRFSRGKLNKYSCLAVVDRTSGDSQVGPRHLNKDGNSVLKDVSNTVFYNALSCRESNGIRRFYLSSLSRTNNSDHARLNTQRKILALMLAIWRNKTEYSDDLVTGRKRAFPSA
jgi:transposase